MASEYVYFKGKTAWCFPNKIDQYGKWSMKLYPDTESLATFKQLQERGVLNELSKDDDGWFIRLGRRATIKVKGADVGQRPPHVFDGTKPLPGGGYVPLEAAIGNGSDVLAKVEVYPYKMQGPGNRKGLAMKWDALRVDTLVPFNTNSYGEDMAKSVEGMDKQPKQLF